MKLRNRVTSNKIQLDMTPMIDVVFQLMIFFMCTLKVTEPEGDFDISMPLGAPGAAVETAELPPFKVRLEADETGELRALFFNGTNLGTGEQAFARLNNQVREAMRALEAIGPTQKDNQEVEIDPDYNLHYRYIISSIGACSGTLGQNGIPVRYLSKIKFAPRREAQ